MVSVVLGTMMSGKYRFENCKQCGWFEHAQDLAPSVKKDALRDGES